MEAGMLTYLMTREQFLGLVRHGITFIGGIIVAKGNFDPSTLDTFTGVGVALAGLIWSAMADEKRVTPERILALMQPSKVEAIEKIVAKAETPATKT